MADSGAIKAGSAFVSIGGDETPLVKALERAQRVMDRWGKNLQNVGRQLSTLGLSLASPLIAAGVAFGKMGEAMYRASQRTGVSVEQLSALGYAAQQSGTDMESLETGVRKMQRTIGEAATGSKEAAEALAGIGVSVDDLKGLSPDQQFIKLAGAIGQISDPTMEAAAAMKVFGKNGTQLLPMINQGADGLNAMIKQAGDLGLVMGGDDAKAASDLYRSLKQLADVLENSIFRIGSAVGPVLKGVADAMTNAAVMANRWISENKGAVVTTLEVASGVAAAGVGIYAFGYAWRFAGTAAGVAASLFSLALSPLGVLAVGVAAVGGAFAYTMGEGDNFFGKLFSGLKLMAGFLDESLGSWQGFKSGLLAAWHGITYQMQKSWLEVKGLLVQTWDYMKAEFPNVIYGWGGAIAGFAVKTWDVMKDLAAAIVNAWQTVIDKISDAFAEVMIRARVEKEMMAAYDGKKLTKKDAEKFATAETAPKLNQLRDATTAQVRKDQPGLSGKAFADEVEKRFNAAAAPIVAEANARFIAKYAGKKLSDDEIQSLIDTETGKQLDAVHRMAQARSEARDKDFADRVGKNADDLRKSRDAIDKWRSDGMGKSHVEQLREAQADQDRIAAEKAALEEEHAKQMAEDLAKLKSMPKLSDRLTGLYEWFKEHVLKGPAGESTPTPNPKLPDGDALEGIMRQVKTAGTFSAAAAFGIGGGGVAERQLDEAKKSNELLIDTRTLLKQIAADPGPTLA